MGVCFKLLDAVSGSWGWNARKRGFLCTACLSTLQGRSSEDWKISFAPGLDKAGLGYVGFSGSCFPRLTENGAICCVLGPRTSDPFMGIQWNISPSHFSVYALPLTCSWTPRNPAAVIAHPPHLSMPGLSSFSVPAGTESGAASGAGTTGTTLTPVSTKDSMRWNMKGHTSPRHDRFLLSVQHKLF